MRRVSKISYVMGVIEMFCLISTFGTHHRKLVFTAKGNISINATHNFHSSLHQYTGYKCQTSSECASSRWCVDWDTFVLCSSFSSVCACVDIDHYICLSSADCLDGDICVKGTSDSYYCWSCEAEYDPSQAFPVDNGNCHSGGGGGSGGGEATGGMPGGGGAGNNKPSGDSANVCIAVDALHHVRREELVFKHHKRAAVLCDQNENCATPGHMVLYRGKAMMMSSYCMQALIFCKRRIKLVNSPRMKAGLRVPSRHPELQFTALSASKQTFVEHAILQVLLHLGV